MAKQKRDISSRFGSDRGFILTVPANYDHDHFLDTFIKQVSGKETVYVFDERMNDKYFHDPSHHLYPGRRYSVEMIPVLGMTSTETCVEFLQKEGCLFVGAHGLVLLYMMESRRIGRGRHVVALDHPEHLARVDQGTPLVPVLSNDKQIFLFDLIRADASWTPVHDLLCFREV